MRERAMDHNVVDALTVAFSSKNLGVEQQSPKESMHRFPLIFPNLTFYLDGIGIGNRDLKVGAA
jgi:hypothetical protein